MSLIARHPYVAVIVQRDAIGTFELGIGAKNVIEAKGVWLNSVVATHIIGSKLVSVRLEPRAWFTATADGLVNRRPRRRQSGVSWS